MKINEECHSLILKYFNNDIKETYLWFNTRNYLLGNVKPIKMIYEGRGKKLLGFIKSQLEGNFP